MGLFTGSARVLLETIADMQDGAQAPKCWSALSRLYEEVAGADVRRLGKYCVHILGDFVTACCEGRGPKNASEAILSVDAVTALKPGAFALMGACSQQDLEGMHSAMGATRRLVLTQLKESYDRDYKYTGKV